ncbi:MAG: hypothetical protein M1814_003844 [Vezdaea aestivalis]|nr:MAG: hypothetical protein M1814_003844 [Vezdaea aestivalis]
MLKSTYKIAAPAQAPPPTPLPTGWTEHKAPAGHTYYHNASTKQSTYTRPQTSSTIPAVPPAAPIHLGGTHPNLTPPFGADPTRFPQNGQAIWQDASRSQFPSHQSGFNPHNSRPRNHPRDRPRSKHIIPGCEPWLLIKTKMRRRFFYDPTQNKSFWKMPENIKSGVEEFDRREKGGPPKNTAGADRTAKVAQGDGDVADEDDDAEDDEQEAEEEDESEEEDDEESHKRPRTDAPREFNEDDIAYQLAAMGADNGDADYYDYPDEDGADGNALTSEEADALFCEMLSEYSLDPFMPWEQVIEETQVVHDERYVVLENKKQRRRVWGLWTEKERRRRRQLREEEELKKKSGDPRAPYLAFLGKNATPKLYWPEFRRKHKKAEEMKEPSVSDKDKEKLYRELVAQLKKSTSSLKSDLIALLTSLPLKILNNQSSTTALPVEILTDLRWVAVDAKIRDPMVEAYIATLPGPPDVDMEDAGEEDKPESSKQRRVREAMEAREREVEEERRQRAKEMHFAKQRMEMGERDLADAMRVGKGGLRTQLRENEP